jgi:hypothetical protein
VHASFRSVPPRARAPLAGLVGGLLALGAAGKVQAEKRELTLAVAPAYAMVYVDSRNPSGGGVALDLSYGVTEALALQATGFLSWHALDATKTLPGGPMSAFSAMLGVRYTVDVIRLVPTFDAALGVLGARGDLAFHSLASPPAPVASSTAFGIQLGFAIDYLVTRHIAVGALIRYHAFLTDLTRIPVYLYVGPRVSFRFGG